MPKRPPTNRRPPARPRAAIKQKLANDEVDPRIGRTLVVRVERIVPGGLGLAHAEGMTLFVALAAPGDTVEARIESARGRVGFARILRVVESAPARVAPPCRYFGGDERCGGCDFQQLAYDAQLAAKLDIIRDALRRTAHIEPPASLAITPAPREWNYRSRVEWQHDARHARLGYYRRGTHDIVDVTSCPVLVPELGKALDSMRGEMRAGALPPDIGEFRFMAGDDDSIAVAPALNDSSIGELSRTIRGEIYRYNADCFFQINHDLLPDLLAEALRPIEDDHAMRLATTHDEAHAATSSFALDLYCGVGLFTVPLARRFRSVIGVEAHPTSAAYGRRNLEAARLAGAQIVTSDVRAWLARFAAELPAPDFVLLDPPRTGAEAETLRRLVELRPRRIAYVSCDPVTLARDLGILVKQGFELESLRAFDLFPQTHHVEAVAQLVRTTSAGDRANASTANVRYDAAESNQQS